MYVVSRKQVGINHRTSNWTHSGYSTVIQLVLGFVFGVSLSMISFVSVCLPSKSSRIRHDVMENTVNEGLRKQTISFKGNFAKDDYRVAGKISEHVKVLCWVLVKDGTFHKTAIHIRNTWGKRCDTLLFFGSRTDKTNRVIGLGIQDGRHRLAKKTFAALDYIFKHHLDDADWFLKADTDTFVIMENLKYFLCDEDTQTAVWFGEHYKPYVSPWHYNSGGAGYVLSKEALRRFSNQLGKSMACTNANGPEDSALGYCLQSLNVKVGNTTDKYGRSRFHFDMAPNHIAGRQRPWYKHYIVDQYRTGIEWLSDYPISFHYAKTGDILALEFYFYTLRPRGIFLGFPEVNKPVLHN